MSTPQIKIWTGKFGADYTDRSRFQNAEEFNALYVRRYGTSRDAIVADWIGHVPRDARILEVGCNIGNQLCALQRAGFTNLFGIDVQRDAVEKAKSATSGLDIVCASAFDIPFKDGYFDLVFTNNVLIHIAPDHIGAVMDEMIRVTSGYIWGFEYFAPEFTEINYRGNENLLWKADYGELFLQRPGGALTMERAQVYDCLDEPGNRDKGYLLVRTPGAGAR